MAGYADVVYNPCLSAVVMLSQGATYMLHHLQTALCSTIYIPDAPANVTFSSMRTATSLTSLLRCLSVNVIVLQCPAGTKLLSGFCSTKNSNLRTQRPLPESAFGSGSPDTQVAVLCSISGNSAGEVTAYAFCC
jgi:hypothetical protein